MVDTADRIIGVMLGTAVGDAIGLPFEGMSRRRVRRLARLPLGHQLVLGRGMTSDDTEHTCMAAQALLASRGDPRRFARSLGWRLRFWLLGLPAGVGKATARAIFKLWLGVPPVRSGVRSAGNGPAMRAAILGAYAATTATIDLKSLVAASTRITHTDERAEAGALAVALAAPARVGAGVASLAAPPLSVIARDLPRSPVHIRTVRPAHHARAAIGRRDALVLDQGAVALYPGCRLRVYVVVY
jgi:ADP-ribosylglycohydrolase